MKGDFVFDAEKTEKIWLNGKLMKAKPGKLELLSGSNKIEIKRL